MQSILIYIHQNTYFLSNKGLTFFLQNTPRFKCNPAVKKTINKLGKKSTY